MSDWLAIAPLLPYADRNDLLQEPVEFSGGVTLGPRPPWITSERLIKNLSFSHRERVRESRFAFCVPYSAESVGDPHPDSKKGGPRSWQDHAAWLIRQANIALWLARPTSIGYETVCHVEQSAKRHRSMRQTATQNPILCHPSDEHAQLQPANLETAKALHTILIGLPKLGTLATSIRYLYKALLEYMWESRYIFLWVVVESLFGPEDARETTYRLSHRVAHFLASDPEQRRKLYRATTRAYGWRSKLIHGGRLTKLAEKESSNVAQHLEDVTRDAYLKILQDGKLLRTFGGKKRETYLDELSFTA